MPMTFDQYSYCSLGCLYCFAYFFKSNNPVSKDKPTLSHVDTEGILNAIRGKPKGRHFTSLYEHFFKRKFLLHWGGLADPFCHFEKVNRKGLELIKGLGQENYPTLFSFKGDTIFDYMNVFDKYSKQKNFAFQCSIITGDDMLAKQIEIGVPSPTKRLEALKHLSDMGYWTILRLRPFVIGVSDRGLDELLSKALKAGIKGVSIEYFACDGRANLGMKTRYDWISKVVGVKDMHTYFSKLSPRERGGYMRLNRDVKEESMWKIASFCRKHGLVLGVSDPDFKELNSTGSCCAMPDSHCDSGNPLLQNWTKNQLTYWLKEARRKHHVEGVASRLRFSEVYADESYLDSEDGISGCHVGVVGMPTPARKVWTYRMLLQEGWNNLRSPSNPRNYFHGKLMPVGLDKHGDMEFEYKEHPYEKRWINNGFNFKY
jgi:DNA repair photolyase